MFLKNAKILENKLKPIRPNQRRKFDRKSFDVNGEEFFFNIYYIGTNIAVKHAISNVAFLSVAETYYAIFFFFFFFFKS